VEELGPNPGSTPTFAIKSLRPEGCAGVRGTRGQRLRFIGTGLFHEGKTLLTLGVGLHRTAGTAVWQWLPHSRNGWLLPESRVRVEHATWGANERSGWRRSKSRTSEVEPGLGPKLPNQWGLGKNRQSRKDCQRRVAARSTCSRTPGRSLQDGPLGLLNGRVDLARRWWDVRSVVVSRTRSGFDARGRGGRVRRRIPSRGEVRDGSNG